MGTKEDRYKGIMLKMHEESREDRLCREFPDSDFAGEIPEVVTEHLNDITKETDKTATGAVFRSFLTDGSELRDG
ncbi:hypothetical protein KY326_01875, partial [Candidatus Woesearchaeota archaeon]|nr:hypothetical protein [Candidatus Woesearchaeota archaeon]